MPGIHTNDCEKHLKTMWASQGAFANALEKISVFHSTGFRGIINCEIEFRYPVSVICGRNGTGKTTTLALAALGYHNNTTFTPHGFGRKYYTFTDFFHRGPHDADYTGVVIEWGYRQRQPLKIQKRSSKWMHYDRRPSKAVQYIATSRVIPAIERQVLKNHFRWDHAGTRKNALQSDYLNYLSRILGHQYTQAEEFGDASHHIRTCHRLGGYSSFNMGAGEDVLIELLGAIQTLPDNSLCIIEEIELGLHPEALRNLAKILLEISEKRRIQLIISTHSRDFLDSVPREARILLRRSGPELIPFYGPTTRFAMGEMGAEREKELIVYCEDIVAKIMIETALDADKRNRVEIVPIGSESSFAAMAKFHFADYAKRPCLFYWDGDMTEQTAEAAKKKLSDADRNLFHYAFLPAKLVPEKYLLTVLSEDCVDLAQRLNISNSNQVKEILESAKTIPDPHDIPHHIAQKVSLDEMTVRNAMVNSVKMLKSSDFQSISDNIQSILDGEKDGI